MEREPSGRGDSTPLRLRLRVKRAVAPLTPVLLQLLRRLARGDCNNFAPPPTAHSRACSTPDYLPLPRHLRGSPPRELASAAARNRSSLLPAEKSSTYPAPAPCPSHE